MKLGFAKRRKTEQITVETEQILVIRRKRVTRDGCGERQEEAELARVEEINGLVDARMIPSSFAPRDPGFHLGKSPDCSTIFCADSHVKKCSSEIEDRNPKELRK